MKKLSLILIIAGLVVISASSFDYSKIETASGDVETMTIPQDDAAAAKYPNGAKNSDFLLADKKRAVKQVLNGSNEAMEVNGATYTIPMPFQVDTHQDAVDVINYVLNAWGNNGGTITLDEVKDIKIVR